jgi:hypothetical protein
MRRHARWLGGLTAISLVVAAAPARAAEGVVVACPQLSIEDAAEVEARTRASLLSEAANVDVRIECDATRARVSVAAAERREVVTLLLPSESLKEALLESVERALQGLEQQGGGTSAGFPDAAHGTEAKPAMPAAPPAKQAAQATPATGPRPAPSRAAPVVFAAGASVMVERWSDAFAFGGRALFEGRASPWAFGLTFGGLIAPEQAGAFVPWEWHLALSGAFEADELGGLVARAGVGVSTLRASPSVDVVARSSTSLTRALFTVALARPLRWKRLALTPELGMRIFTGRREVTTDGTPQLAVPVVVPAGSVTVTYEL